MAAKLVTSTNSEKSSKTQADKANKSASSSPKTADKKRSKMEQQTQTAVSHCNKSPTCEKLYYTAAKNGLAHKQPSEKVVTNNYDFKPKKLEPTAKEYTPKKLQIQPLIDDQPLKKQHIMTVSTNEFIPRKLPSLMSPCAEIYEPKNYHHYRNSFDDVPLKQQQKTIIPFDQSQRSIKTPFNQSQKIAMSAVNQSETCTKPTFNQSETEKPHTLRLLMQGKVGCTSLNKFPSRPPWTKK